jgi:hypothetical protein
MGPRDSSTTYESYSNQEILRTFFVLLSTPRILRFAWALFPGSRGVRLTFRQLSRQRRCV